MVIMGMVYDIAIPTVIINFQVVTPNTGASKW